MSQVMYHLSHVMCHVSHVSCHLSPVTCHQHQQPQQQTLPLLTPPLCTVVWLNKTEPKNTLHMFLKVAEQIPRYLIFEVGFFGWGET